MRQKGGARLSNRTTPCNVQGAEEDYERLVEPIPNAAASRDGSERSIKRALEVVTRWRGGITILSKRKDSRRRGEGGSAQHKVPRTVRTLRGFSRGRTLQRHSSSPKLVNHSLTHRIAMPAWTWFSDVSRSTPG